VVDLLGVSGRRRRRAACRQLIANETQKVSYRSIWIVRDQAFLHDRFIPVVKMLGLGRNVRVIRCLVVPVQTTALRSLLPIVRVISACGTQPHVYKAAVVDQQPQLQDCIGSPTDAFHARDHIGEFSKRNTFDSGIHANRAPPEGAGCQAAEYAPADSPTRSGLPRPDD